MLPDRRAVSANRWRSHISVPRARPASAKERFEAINQKRNKEIMEFNKWKETADSFKKKEFEAMVYTHLSSSEKKDSISEAIEQQRIERLVKRRKMLRDLFEEDEKKYEEEKIALNLQNKPARTSYGMIKNMEVEALKQKLDELKKQNAEERRKMSENMSYEVWRKNNPDVREMESKRLNEFMHKVWNDQKLYKEEEKKRIEEERRKEAEEAEKEHEKALEEINQRKLQRMEELTAWKQELDQQVRFLREAKEKEQEIIFEEASFQKMQSALQNTVSAMDNLKTLKHRKELEMHWARQYQLKLKQKSSLMQDNLLQEEKIVLDLLNDIHRNTDIVEQLKEKTAEAERLKRILEEQRRLEKCREKEYDLLFSEESEKMWNKRQQEWNKEEEAREVLLNDVIAGIKQQITDKLGQNKRDIKELKETQVSCQTSIEDLNSKIETGEEVKANDNPFPFNKPNLKELNNKRTFLEEQAEAEKRLEDHRLEILRLENEMKKLWHNSYVPPAHGRRKVTW